MTVCPCLAGGQASRVGRGGYQRRYKGDYVHHSCFVESAREAGAAAEIARRYLIINVKKLRFRHKLTANDTSKAVKITKKR